METSKAPSAPIVVEQPQIVTNGHIHSYASIDEDEGQVYNILRWS